MCLNSAIERLKLLPKMHIASEVILLIESIWSKGIAEYTLSSSKPFTTIDDLFTTLPLNLNIKKLIFNPLNVTQNSSAYDSQIDAKESLVIALRVGANNVRQ